MTTALNRFIYINCTLGSTDCRRPDEARPCLRRHALRLLADALAVGTHDLRRAIAGAPRLAAHAYRRVVVLVAGEVVRIGIAGGAEILLRTAAREAECDHTGKQADRQEPLHTSDDG